MNINDKLVATIGDANYMLLEGDDQETDVYTANDISEIQEILINILLGELKYFMSEDGTIYDYDEAQDTLENLYDSIMNRSRHGTISLHDIEGYYRGVPLQLFPTRYYIVIDIISCKIVSEAGC